MSIKYLNVRILNVEITLTNYTVLKCDVLLAL